MAKGKAKDDVANPNNVPNRDIMQRMNFLYQAAAYLTEAEMLPERYPAPVVDSHLSEGVDNNVEGMDQEPLEDGEVQVDGPPEEDQGAPNGGANSTTAKRQCLSRKEEISLFDLASTYTKSMKDIGLKTNVRIDPSIKRTLCKACHLTLIPPYSANIRISRHFSAGHAVRTECQRCGFLRRIPCAPEPGPEQDVHEEAEAENGKADLQRESTEAVDLPATLESAPKGKRYRHKRKGRTMKIRGRKRIKLHEKNFFEKDHAVYAGNASVT